MRFAFLLLAASLGGCAFQPRVAEPLPGEVKSVQAAREAVTLGKSTKADVRAALGKGTEVDFDSGYAVWVYRQQLLQGQPGPRRELVLLFSPQGRLYKARTR